MLDAKIQASKDGLWLHCSRIDGVHESINLLMEDSHREKQILNQLWQKLYNKPVEPTASSNRLKP